MKNEIKVNGYKYVFENDGYAGCCINCPAANDCGHGTEIGNFCGEDKVCVKKEKLQLWDI